jgi:hypothetical protein
MLIQDALKMGFNSHKLSQQANVELRGQRDQIVNIVNLVREVGMDLFKADKISSDINYRRLLNIMMLYLTIMLLFISICLVLYHKFMHSWLWALIPHHFHQGANTVSIGAALNQSQSMP